MKPSTLSSIFRNLSDQSGKQLEQLRHYSLRAQASAHIEQTTNIIRRLPTEFHKIGSYSLTDHVKTSMRHRTYRQAERLQHQKQSGLLQSFLIGHAKTSFESLLQALGRDEIDESTLLLIRPFFVTLLDTTHNILANQSQQSWSGRALWKIKGSNQRFLANGKLNPELLAEATLLLAQLIREANVTKPETADRLVCQETLILYKKLRQYEFQGDNIALEKEIARQRGKKISSTNPSSGHESINGHFLASAIQCIIYAHTLASGTEQSVAQTRNRFLDKAEFPDVHPERVRHFELMCRTAVKQPSPQAAFHHSEITLSTLNYHTISQQKHQGNSFNLLENLRKYSNGELYHLVGARLLGPTATPNEHAETARCIERNKVILETCKTEPALLDQYIAQRSQGGIQVTKWTQNKLDDEPSVSFFNYGKVLSQEKTNLFRLVLPFMTLYFIGTFSAFEILSVGWPIPAALFVLCCINYSLRYQQIQPPQGQIIEILKQTQPQPNTLQPNSLSCHKSTVKNAYLIENDFAETASQYRQLPAGISLRPMTIKPTSHQDIAERLGTPLHRPTAQPAPQQDQATLKRFERECKALLFSTQPRDAAPSLSQTPTPPTLAR